MDMAIKIVDFQGATLWSKVRPPHNGTAPAAGLA